MSTLILRVKQWWLRARGAVTDWTWAPVAGRGLLWLGAFLALSHVGSGAAARLVDPDKLAGADQAVVAYADPEPSASEPSAAQSSAAESSAAESSTPAPLPSAVAACGGGKGLTADGRVVLNAASVADLVRLPSVGEKRAAAIVALRAKLGGRFRRVEDLMRVRGIGYKLLKRLRPLVVLDPPEDNSDGAGGSRGDDH